MGHTSLVRDGDAADDSCGLQSLISSVFGAVSVEGSSLMKVGAKANVVGIVLLVCPVRSCVDRACVVDALELR